MFIVFGNFCFSLDWGKKFQDLCLRKQCDDDKVDDDDDIHVCDVRDSLEWMRMRKMSMSFSFWDEHERKLSFDGLFRGTKRDKTSS